MASEQHCAGRRAKKAWKLSRNFSKKKNADGEIIKMMGPGPSLKVWVKKQVADNTVEAEDCKVWLKSKATKQVRKQKQITIKKDSGDKKR